MSVGEETTLFSSKSGTKILLIVFLWVGGSSGQFFCVPN